MAYALFFNFVAGRVTKEEKSSLASYMRYNKLDAVDIDLLMSASNDFSQAYKAIDREGAPTSDALRQRKSNLADEAITSLPVRVGTHGAESLRRHVTDLKTKMKIIPGPVMPGA